MRQKPRKNGNIFVDWGWMLDSSDDGIIMGEAIWIKEQPVQGNDMKPLQQDLVNFQSNLSEAAVACFGDNACVKGMRFFVNGILVTFYVSNDDYKYVSMPYDYINASTPEMVRYIRSELEKEKRESDTDGEEVTNQLEQRFRKIS